MAKISRLDPSAPLVGDEKIPLVQDGTLLHVSPRDLSHFVDPFDESATNLDAYLASITRAWDLTDLDPGDLRVSFLMTAVNALVIDIWNEQLGGPVGFISISNPDYANLPEAIPVISRNRLVGVYPQTGPNTGLLGYWFPNRERIIVAPANVNTSFVDPLQSRINRKAVKHRLPAMVRQSNLAEKIAEHISVGPNHPFTTIGAARDSLLDAPLADADNPSQILRTARAGPDHQIGLVLEPGQWPDVSQHLPEFVHLISRVPHQAELIHAAGAGRSIIEGGHNNSGFGLRIRNTADPINAVTAQYGWHHDKLHMEQAQTAQGTATRLSHSGLYGCQLVRGGNVQVLGMGLGAQDFFDVEDCELLIDGYSGDGLIIAANNSSNVTGGGILRIRRTVDKTGRSVPAIGVQTKTDTPLPNILQIDDSPTIESVSLAQSGVPDPIGDFDAWLVGKWLLKGNNQLTAADIVSGIPGDTMGL